MPAPTTNRHGLLGRLRARFALLLACVGCSNPERPTPEQSARGRIVMLPGIEGGAWSFASTTRGLRDAGVPYAIDIVEWGVRPLGSLPNLVDLAANRRSAAEIAARIEAYQRAYPGRPVFLVGFSGGGGVALMAAEALPPDVTLERLVLIGAAVSPTYDVAPAAARCRRGVVCFYSERDAVMLRWGTRTFGTIDRKYSDSAGLVGFRDGSGRLLQRDDLTQVAWSPDWRRLGHHGGHIDWLARGWAHEVLAPWLCVEPTTTSAAAENQHLVVPCTGPAALP